MSLLILFKKDRIPVIPFFAVLLILNSLYGFRFQIEELQRSLLEHDNIVDHVYAEKEKLNSITANNLTCDSKFLVNVCINNIWPVYEVDGLVNLKNNISVAAPYSVKQWFREVLPGSCGSHRTYELLKNNATLSLLVNEEFFSKEANSSYNTFNISLKVGKNNISATLIVQANYQVTDVIGTLVCIAGKCSCAYSTYEYVHTETAVDKKNSLIEATAQNIIGASMIPVDKQILKNTENGRILLASAIPLLLCDVYECGMLKLGNDSIWTVINYTPTKEAVYGKLNLSQLFRNSSEYYRFAFDYKKQLRNGPNTIKKIFDVFGNEYIAKANYSLLKYGSI